jgi:hypothetical protein
LPVDRILCIQEWHRGAPRAARVHAGVLCRYDLVSVVVHHGHSVSSGHYVAYVRSPSGIWHLCDDQRVCTVKPACVLRQQAYLLMYGRRTARTWLLPREAVRQAEAAAAQAEALPPTPREPPFTRSSGPAPHRDLDRVQQVGGGLRGGDATAAGAASQMPIREPPSHSRNVAGQPASERLLPQPCTSASPRSKIVPLRMKRSLSITGRSTRNVQLMQASCLSSQRRWALRRLGLLASSTSTAAATCPSPVMRRRTDNAPVVTDSPNAGLLRVPRQLASARVTMSAAAPPVATPPSAGGNADTQVPEGSSLQALAQRIHGRSEAAHSSGGGNESAAGEHMTMSANVAELLWGPGRRQLTDVGKWDETDEAVMKCADDINISRQAQLGHRARNEYDEAYDRGKAKKRRKHREAQRALGLDVFHAAAVKQLDRGGAKNAKAPCSM